MTFEDQISKTINEKLNSESIQKAVDDALTKCISEAVINQFNYNGDCKQLIDKKLKEILVPAIENHDFNQYLTKLDDMLTTIINQTDIVDNKTILDNFKDLMVEPDKKEYKISEIFAAYCEHVANYVDTSKLEIMHEDTVFYENVSAELEVEYEDSYRGRLTDAVVTLSCEKDEDLTIKIRLYKAEDATKWSMLTDANSIELRSLRYASKFEILLTKIKRSYAKIVIDEKYMDADDIEVEEEPTPDYI